MLQARSRKFSSSLTLPIATSYDNGMYTCCLQESNSVQTSYSLFMVKYIILRITKIELLLHLKINFGPEIDSVLKDAFDLSSRKCKNL